MVCYGYTCVVVRVYEVKVVNSKTTYSTALSVDTSCQTVHSEVRNEVVMGVIAVGVVLVKVLISGTWQSVDSSRLRNHPIAFEHHSTELSEICKYGIGDNVLEVACHLLPSVALVRYSHVVLRVDLVQTWIEEIVVPHLVVSTICMNGLYIVEIRSLSIIDGILFSAIAPCTSIVEELSCLLVALHNGEVSFHRFVLL